MFYSLAQIQCSSAKKRLENITTSSKKINSKKKDTVIEFKLQTCPIICVAKLINRFVMSIQAQIMLCYLVIQLKEWIFSIIQMQDPQLNITINLKSLSCKKARNSNI